MWEVQQKLEQQTLIDLIWVETDTIVGVQKLSVKPVTTEKKLRCALSSPDMLIHAGRTFCKRLNPKRRSTNANMKEACLLLKYLSGALFQRKYSKLLLQCFVERIFAFLDTHVKNPHYDRAAYAIRAQFFNLNMEFQLFLQ